MVILWFILFLFYLEGYILMCHVSLFNSCLCLFSLRYSSYNLVSLVSQPLCIKVCVFLHLHLPLLFTFSWRLLRLPFCCLHCGFCTLALIRKLAFCLFNLPTSVFCFWVLF